MVIIINLFSFLSIEINFKQYYSISIYIEGKSALKRKYQSDVDLL